MNRTSATCIAGMKTKAASRTSNHFFHERLDFGFFAFGFFGFDGGIRAKRTAGENRVQLVFMDAAGFSQKT